MSERWLTIGVEEEFQIVDSEGQLRSHIDTLMEAATPALGEQVKAEMLQSVVEVGTTICENVDELRVELVRLRGTLASLLLPAGLRLIRMTPSIEGDLPESPSFYVEARQAGA